MNRKYATLADRLIVCFKGRNPITCGIALQKVEIIGGLIMYLGPKSCYTWPMRNDAASQKLQSANRIAELQRKAFVEISIEHLRQCPPPQGWFYKVWAFIRKVFNHG